MIYLDDFSYTLNKGDVEKFGFLSEDNCKIILYKKFESWSKSKICINASLNLFEYNYLFKLDVFPDDEASLEALIQHLEKKISGIPIDKAKLYYPHVCDKF